MSKSLTLIWNNWKTSLLSGGLLVVLLLILWNANAFAQLRLSLSNAYFVSTSTSESIVIVAIDDKSLAQYGRTPAEWSRALFGELADIVSEQGARVLAYDLIFSESTADDDLFAEALLTARQSDARTRIVLAGAGVQVPSDNLNVAGFSNGLQYSASLEPNPVLRQTADYIGYANAFPDVDSRLRRQPSLIELNEQLQVSFNLALFFAQRRIPFDAIPQVISADENNLYLTEELTLPVDERGLWLQNYFGVPYVPEQNEVFPVLSFVDVIEGNVDGTIFADKIVMVGLIGSLGATDQYPVPSSSSGSLMSGVEIQANAVESLLSGTPLVRQSLLSEALMIVGLTVFSSFLFDKPRWYLKLLLWLGVIILFFVVGFLLFVTQHQVINLFYGALSISLPVVFSIGLEISREITRRRRSEFLLQSIVSIAEQNMVIDNILLLIADDIQSIITDCAGFVWAYTSSSRTTPNEHRWRASVSDQSLTELAHKSIKNQSTQHTDTQLAVPMIWQGEIQGVLAAQSNNSITQAQISLIQDLAQRLAPTFDNLTLHRSLDQQNHLLELILSNSPASIVVIDPAYKILRTNQRFSQWMAIANKDLLQNEFFSLLKQRGINDQYITQLEQKLDGLGNFDLEIRDDQNHVLRLSAVPLTKLGHWVMILVDISDLVQLNELKTQMIRMASHDLKNPLSRVLGYAEIIATSGSLDETNTRFMNNVMNAGDEINQIITDILDLEQLRSGQMERKSASFKNLVREIVSRHEPDKDRKQQTLTLEMLDEPVTVLIDYMRLGQAVSNLIGNAIKYTQDEGTIHVRVWQPDAHSVQLEVSDNGYGIPEASQAKLFTEFYRVKTNSTRGISGTGLGLSLVKSVVEAHDGTVRVESTEGEGSTFYVLLPTASADMGIGS